MNRQALSKKGPGFEHTDRQRGASGNRRVSREVAGVPRLTAASSAWRQVGALTSIAGHQIFVRERAGTADAAPLLFLHGYPSSSYDWRHALAGLGERRLIMFDFLGFGLSDKPRDQVYSLLTQADIVEAIVARFANEPVVLVAHDMGAGDRGLVAEG